MSKKQVLDICPKCNPTSYDKSLFTYQNESNVFDDAGTQVKEYVYACNDCGAKVWIDENWIAENGVDDVVINVDSLDDAIKDFNDWGKGASIVLDKNDGYFSTVVYHNDVQAVQSRSPKNFITVYYKDEIDGQIKIGPKRRNYIEQYASLIIDGWTPDQADYKLSDIYC